MTLILELPSQLESRLAEMAAADGATVEAVAIKVLSVGVSMDAPAQTDGAVSFSSDRQQRNAQIRALLTAPADVREATMRAGAEAAAPFYEQSLREDGELTAITTAPGDIHEYDGDELTAMKAGAFDGPLR